MLNVLKDNKGAKHKKKLVGRGIGSGKGKTSGRGGKGQTARSGVAIKGFEGGQTPLQRRLPKRGFNNYTRKKFAVINFDQIQHLFDNKKLAPNKTITIGLLKEVGLYSNTKDRLKFLASGEFSQGFNIEVHAFSRAAEERLKEKGGKFIQIPFKRVVYSKDHDIDINDDAATNVNADQPPSRTKSQTSSPKNKEDGANQKKTTAKEITKKKTGTKTESKTKVAKSSAKAKSTTSKSTASSKTSTTKTAAAKKSTTTTRKATATKNKE